MKRLFSFVFVIWAGLSAYAQELTVKSLVEDTKDLAARTSVRYDLSDEPCALIKVYMAVSDATFSGNVVHSEMKAASEYWVYVSHGTKHLQINTAGYLPIDVIFANYGIAAVTKQVTYKLIVNVPELTNKPKVVTEQYVEFTVEPRNAMVEFDGKVVPLDKYGTASIYQHFGTYSYRVTANLYHAQQGEVVVNDPNNAHRVSVQLQPAFGYIKVPDAGTWKGATVYINNEMKGTTPFTSDKLASGRYNVRVVRPMYSSEEQSLVVEDGKTAVFSRALQPQFVTLTLSVKDKAAEIWVNGKKYNTGTWRGDLGFGSYKVECKKTNHRTAETTLNVAPDMATIVNLPSPTPITGGLDITSTPSGANIYLDGQNVGATPKLISDVLIGNHKVELRREGMVSSSRNITIEEGKTFALSMELSAATGGGNYSSSYSQNTSNTSPTNYKYNPSQITLADLLQRPFGIQGLSWSDSPEKQKAVLTSIISGLECSQYYKGVVSGYSISNGPSVYKPITGAHIDLLGSEKTSIYVTYTISVSSFEVAKTIANSIRNDLIKYGFSTMPAFDSKYDATTYKNTIIKGFTYGWMCVRYSKEKVEINFRVKRPDAASSSSDSSTQTTDYSDSSTQTTGYEYNPSQITLADLLQRPFGIQGLSWADSREKQRDVLISTISGWGYNSNEGTFYGSFITNGPSVYKPITGAYVDLEVNSGKESVYMNYSISVSSLQEGKEIATKIRNDLIKYGFSTIPAFDNEHKAEAYRTTTIKGITYGYIVLKYSKAEVEISFRVERPAATSYSSDTSAETTYSSTSSYSQSTSNVSTANHKYDPSKITLADLLRHPFGIRRLSWSDSPEKQQAALTSTISGLTCDDKGIAYGSFITNGPTVYKPITGAYINTLGNKGKNVYVTYTISVSSLQEGKEIAAKVRNDLTKYGFSTIPAFDKEHKAMTYTTTKVKGTTYGWMGVEFSKDGVEIRFSVERSAAVSSTR